MKRFELWLDESGDFQKDRRNVKRGWNPSLIGGVLFDKEKKEILSERVLSNIMDEDYSHATEEEKNVTFNKFKKIVETGTQLVIFENTECIMVVDHNLTYQNIIAEGIMQLIGYLKMCYGEIKLDILLEGRRKKIEEKEYVEKEEYEKRLYEKIIMAGYNYKIKEYEWTLNTVKGKTDKKMMIADNVCNVFLTRNTKFTGEQSEFVMRVYNNKDITIKFTVFKNSLVAKFESLLLENRIGEAVSVICQSDSKEVIEEKMDIITKRLQPMSSSEVQLQYRFIKSLLDYYLNISKDYNACERLLKNLLEYFIPILKKNENWNSNITDILTFDIKFYLLTVYTHQGNVTDSQVLEEQMDEEVKRLPIGWESLDDMIKYQSRKVINKINLYDFEEAWEQNNVLIDQCKNMKEALSLYREDLKYVELAKAFGNMVQIYFFTLRWKLNLYEEAVEISDEAINEFILDSDKERQYLYRVQLETEAGKYDKALEYLYKSMKLPLDVQKKKLKEKLIKSTDYVIMAFVRLMAEGKINNWNFADEMYTLLESTEIIKNLVLRDKKGHPLEVILWKYATYMALANKNQAANNAYKNAIDMSAGDDELTIRMIGLAVDFERYAMALKSDWKEKVQLKKSLMKNYQNLYEKVLPDSMKRIYAEIDWNKNDWKYYWDLSRKITY